MAKTAFAALLLLLGSSSAAYCQIVNTPAAANGFVREVTTGTTDTALITDDTIAWRSTSSGAKTETLLSCTSALNGKRQTIIDAANNASPSAPINMTPAAGTIGPAGGASFALISGGQSQPIQCDGAATNWLLQ